MYEELTPGGGGPKAFADMSAKKVSFLNSPL